jgi:hypothetical protein
MMETTDFFIKEGEIPLYQMSKTHLKTMCYYVMPFVDN